ncbi:hypothetical protein, partial [Escherichia coli]|uniref:hypothetical protein n=1 Tax=Escherichia coli TaxID=562 RepID=UPI001BFBFBDD
IYETSSRLANAMMLITSNNNVVALKKQVKNTEIILSISRVHRYPLAGGESVSGVDSAVFKW